MVNQNNTSEELQHTNRSIEQVMDYKNVGSQPSLLKLYGVTDSNDYIGLLGDNQAVLNCPQQGLKIGGGIYRDPNLLLV